MKLPSVDYIGASVYIMDGNDLMHYVESFKKRFDEIPRFKTINGKVEILNECYKEAIELNERAVREFYNL